MGENSSFIFTCYVKTVKVYDFKLVWVVLDPSVQSASKHGRRTFLYNAIRELVCNGQLWARAALEAASQLQGRIAGAFSSNSLVNTMEMTVAIQYILTAAQSLGSQDYYKKSRMTTLGTAGILFYENEQA